MHIYRSKSNVISVIKSITIPVYPESYIFLAAFGTFVSTISVMRRSLEANNENARMIIESYNRINKAGAIFAAGTDNMGILDTVGKNACELELLTTYCDISPMDVVVMATRNGAKACFMGDKTGTIEAGKLADIIVVNGDPLRDITVLQNADNVEIVMLEGNIEKHI